VGAKHWQINRTRSSDLGRASERMNKRAKRANGTGGFTRWNFSNIVFTRAHWTCSQSCRLDL